jgi:hypothetical protein
VPGSFGLLSAVFAATTIRAPSRAARTAIARPMPRDAPGDEQGLASQIHRVSPESAPRGSFFRGSVPQGRGCA